MKALAAIIIVLALSINSTYAQSGGLTKEETIKYINRKLKEVQEHKTGWSDGKTAYILKNSMESLGDGKYEYQYYYSNGKNFCNATKDGQSGSQFYNEFKPSYIKSIQEEGVSEYNSSIGIIRVTLQNKAVKRRVKDYQHTAEDKYKKVYQYTDFFGRAHYDNDYSHTVYGCKNSDREASYIANFAIYYLKIDSEDGKKMVKALQYLTDLEKAEDDPFG